MKMNQVNRKLKNKLKNLERDLKTALESLKISHIRERLSQIFQAIGLFLLDRDLRVDLHKTIVAMKDKKILHLKNQTKTLIET